MSSPTRPIARPHPVSRLSPPIRLGLAACLACITAGILRSEPEPPQGLPFVRTYPLDEIGNVPRGLRLGFDAFGRVAVMYDGIYSVLNDSAWVDRMDASAVSRVRMTTIKVANGKYFYGGRGSWGTAEPGSDGNFHAVPLVPADAPAWTQVTAFNKLLGTRRGMYFYEINGVVFLDYATRHSAFFEMPRVTVVFPVGDRVFVSCQDRLIRELLPDSGSSRVTPAPGLDGQVVEYAVALDDTRALLALSDGRLVSFDGAKADPWGAFSKYDIAGKITALERLVDGGVAVAIEDKGIFLFSAGGTLQWSLAASEFRRVRTMAADEPGVLWVAGVNAVHRIFYDSPLTSFGQQAGLKASWSHLAFWNNKTLVCSNRTLYEAGPGGPGLHANFHVLAGGPARPIDYVAADGSLLLAATPTEVLAVSDEGRLTPLVAIENVAGLQFIAPDTCIAIGSREIAALRYANGKWFECAPRIPGVGDAPVHLQMHRYLWIELGGDQVARLAVRDGQIDLRRIAPWSGQQWTNVGRIGDTIVLTGAAGQRTYYDEARDTLTTAPHLDQLLRRSPYWLLRMTQDESGTVWATHAQGVVTFTPKDGDYLMDPTTFELRNDSYPTVAVLPDNSIWIAAGWSLYHVEPLPPRTLRRPNPRLVSLFSDRSSRELLDQAGRTNGSPRFSYDANSLTFRFFSGTYAWRFPPLYEYRLGPGEPWAPIDPSLVLRFPKLRDGSYVLEVRQAGPHAADPPPLAFAFVIDPPWYRTPASYAAYSVVLILAVLGIASWINHQSLRRNLALERQVRERTKELEVTMQKLGEETRNTATLAERSRLAGEIHDSVQQGLSGTILHLETTMTHPSIAPEVYTQLSTMRNMLSYSREEVQQAVWNLESPLLQNSTLSEALRKLASYIHSGSITIDVTARAEPPSLDPTVRHNLLRIAQEAITNAVKHAGARRIEIILQADAAGALVLQITDDGQGFNPAARSQVEGHFGLRGLRMRAKAINAQLAIASSPGAGTTVSVTVPAAQS